MAVFLNVNSSFWFELVKQNMMMEILLAKMLGINEIKVTYFKNKTLVWIQSKFLDVIFKTWAMASSVDLFI